MWGCNPMDNAHHAKPVSCSLIKRNEGGTKFPRAAQISVVAQLSVLVAEEDGAVQHQASMTKLFILHHPHHCRGLVWAEKMGNHLVWLTPV